MDKKVKAFFAAMGIATALLVSVSASADNSDSEVQVASTLLGTHWSSPIQTGSGILRPTHIKVAVGLTAVEILL